MPHRPIPSPIPPVVAAQFWRRVKKTRKCWLWAPRGAVVTHRASFYYAGTGETFLAARVAWVLVNGPIPDGLDVLHTCDDEACVRADPDPRKSHLFLGTPKMNAQDAAQKGRLHVRKSSPLFTPVNVRLYAEDVEWLKKRAEEAGETNWQPRLRRLIHEARKAQERIIR